MGYLIIIVGDLCWRDEVSPDNDNSPVDSAEDLRYLGTCRVCGLLQLSNDPEPCCIDCKFLVTMTERRPPVI